MDEYRKLAYSGKDYLVQIHIDFYIAAVQIASVINNLAYVSNNEQFTPYFATECLTHTYPLVDHAGANLSDL